MSIVKITYKDPVTEHIYTLVFEETLHSGDQLKESILAKQMGISRAPKREL